MKTLSLLEYDVRDDGTRMIAVSSRGRTLLGRLLAAGAYLPVDMGDRGRFQSLAGFIRYLTGDRREINRGICGVEYDDALNDTVPEPYHEILQHYVMQMMRSPRAVEKDLLGLLRSNSMPLAVFYDVGEELMPLPMPEWYLEVLSQIRRRAA